MFECADRTARFEFHAVGFAVLQHRRSCGALTSPNGFGRVPPMVVCPQMEIVARPPDPSQVIRSAI